MMRPEMSRQLARYVAVGILGYALTLLVFSIGLHFGMTYPFAAALAFAFALVHNFLWNRRWTFKAHLHPMLPQAVRYAGLAVVSLACNIGMLHLLVSVGAPELLAEAAAVLLIVPFSFLAQRRWGFVTGTADDHACSVPYVGEPR